MSMTCQEFLSRHAEYIDGRMDGEGSARLKGHIEGCESCRRYDRVLRQGLALYRELPPVAPSEDFSERLQHRLLHLQDELSRHDRFAGSGAFASLTIAALIALVAWGPVVFAGSAEARLGRATAYEVGQVAAPVAEAGTVEERTPSGEWFGQTPLYDGRMRSGSSLSAAFPGPYSPLIVEPPVTGASPRAARAVFAAYYPTLE